MMHRRFCYGCCWELNCKQKKENCSAAKALHKICDEHVTAAKEEIILDYARVLDVIECEVSPNMQKMGEEVIAVIPELDFIRNFGVKIGYVISYHHKQKDGKIVCGECKKISGTYTAFLPFDFVITFYQPNISYMSENQKKILMLHELKHIGMGDRGLRVEPHDVDDFDTILVKYGIKWNVFGHDVPDILEDGGDHGEEASQKKKKAAKNR